MDYSLDQIEGFLKAPGRSTLKAYAASNLLRFSCDDEVKDSILNHSKLLITLLGLTCDEPAQVALDSTLCFVNLTSDEISCQKLYQEASQAQPRFPLVENAIKHIMDENSDLAEAWTMVLTNLTRSENLAQEVFNDMKKEDEQIISKLVNVFTKTDYNKKKRNLQHLALIFCNYTRLSEGRELFSQSSYYLLDKIVPFISYQCSIVRRTGVIGVLKNICLDPLHHDAILFEKNEILPSLLYPLCGPEEFSDEETEKFPIELQYLPATKTRENYTLLRKTLLEALLQLCATKRHREFLRSKGVYEILREYHKWESSTGKDKESLLACENVVDILIKKEDEIGLDNYKDVEVPEEMTDKFEKEDAEYLKD